jgi:hypothetical protein
MSSSYRTLFLFLGNFLIYSLNKLFKLYPALRLRLLSLGGEHAELFPKPGSLDILHLAGCLKLGDLSLQVFVDRAKDLKLGSPGIPVVTPQSSLAPRVKLLEILGRSSNDVLFSREFRESLKLCFVNGGASRPRCTGPQAQANQKPRD